MKGLALIDTVIAIGFIIIAGLVLAVFVFSTDLRQSGNFEAQAARIATDEMEQLRALPFNSLPASGTFTTSDLSRLPSGAGSFTVGTFQGDARVKEANVYVRWVDDGRPKEYRQTTLLVEGGI